MAANFCTLLLNVDYTLCIEILNTDYQLWKKIVLWLAENSGANVIKASISNYASTLTQNSHTFRGVRNKFKLDTEDGMFYKFMYSSKFYDFDSEEYHRVLLQEKLNGAYVM